MAKMTASRKCGQCYFGRDLGGLFCCVRDPPALDVATGEARWPRVRKGDRCGAFRYSAAHAGPIDRTLRGILPIYADEGGEYCRIPLTRGHYAKVDPADYGWLSQFRWHYVRSSRTFYAVRTRWENGRGGKVWMHREVMGTPEGLVCDHINHNGLDNRRGNLRNCTTAENNLNRQRYRRGRSRYRGVFWSKEMQMWAAGIQAKGLPRHLGYFTREIDAARAYDAAARRGHGVFANLNFPDETGEERATGPPG